MDKRPDNCLSIFYLLVIQPVTTPGMFGANRKPPIALNRSVKGEKK